MWDTAAVSSFVTLPVGTRTALAPRCCNPVLTALTPHHTLWSCPFPAGQRSPAFALRPEIVSSFYFGCLIRMQLDPFLMTNLLSRDIKMCPILFFILQQQSKPVVEHIALNIETLPSMTVSVRCDGDKEKSLVSLCVTAPSRFSNLSVVIDQGIAATVFQTAGRQLTICIL